jgi:hypothetical protein
MKKIAASINKFFEIIGSIIFIALYAATGCVLAIAYTFLAGWDEYGPPVELGFIAMILPIVVITLKAIYDLPEHIPYHRKTPGLFRKIFWALLGYCLLPIIMNEISMAAHWAGLTATGKTLFSLRYHSLWMAPTLILTGLFIFFYARALWRNHQPNKNLAPPPNIAPSDPGTGNPTKTEDKPNLACLKVIQCTS